MTGKLEILTEYNRKILFYRFKKIQKIGQVLFFSLWDIR